MTETPHIQRREFLQALDRHIADAQALLGLVLIDITNLAKINHQLGFDCGDQLIVEFHARLLSISKLPETIFRIGGHHFVFILPALANPAFLALAMNRINRLLAAEFIVADTVILAEIQLGVVIDLERQLDALGYLAAAEQSLIKAKAGIPYAQHDAQKVQAALQQQNLEQPFKETLQRNGFELYYQPKLNFHTGRIDQAEALLRWQLPAEGFISPEVAIELAQQLGESYALAKWVMHTAVRQIKHWQTRMDIGIAVNIQAGLLAGPDLVTLVHDALAIWGADKNKLTLEITESAVIEDKESGFNNLLQLQNMGIALSIDDFGTGYSSLSYFKEIPAHELKIDKSFVMNMLSNQQDQDIVKIIIDIAHLFNLTVVAEGIEDEATLNYLKSLGCDYGQGYYISHPLPAAKFEEWYDRYSGASN